MGMFHKIKVGDQVISPIDWEMRPELTFGTFESWGGRERVRNNDERIYYFFIDDWGERPKLCLMERGVKHAKVLAEIKAPLAMLRACVDEQGYVARFEQSFAINDEIRDWLIDNVLDDDGDSALVVPVIEEEETEDMGAPLPARQDVEGVADGIILPVAPAYLQEEETGGLLARYGFFDAELNPTGGFANCFVDSGDERTVIDLRTGLMWQRGGLDINSIRQMRKEIAECNANTFAGHADWRMPTVEEAMSLMESEKNGKGLFLHLCFSRKYPFIFVEARRKPGGYWFVDYKQGRLFWSSGTIPGGFGRLVRTLT
ncbi:MAG: DUF1566 domain-containing protein [Desulfopila sp.]